MATLHGIYSVRLVDKNGVIGNHATYHQIPDSLTVAQLVTACADENLLLDPLTDAAGVSARLEIFMPTTNLKSTATVANFVEKGALFQFVQAVLNRAYGIVIPAFAIAKIAAGKVNMADSDVLAWIAEVKNASNVIPFESNVQQLLPSLRRVKLNTRKHRRAEELESTEPGS